MKAIAKWKAPTPTQQPGFYVVKIEIGKFNFIYQGEVFYDKKEAQKLADKVNKEITEEKIK